MPHAHEDSPDPHGAPFRRVRFAVLTVSDSRTLDTDESGALAAELIVARHDEVVLRDLCPDDPERIRAIVQAACGRPDLDILVITGGTGLGSRDGTREAIAPLMTVELPGFGELFRMLSYEEIGAAAMLSRAVAGIAGGKAVFLLPGFPSAVRLAMEKLILPQASHVVSQLRT